MTPKKGPDLLIQALNKVHSFDSNIALVIVGGTWYSVDKVTDYAAYIRTLAERASFPVITTGYVSADLIHQWFWAGDIFVCPSQWQEPLARVHYEAMAAGLPFLTTARGGNPEVVIEQNGLIVERPEDTNEFADKLKILLSDPKLRQIMGQNGRRLAEERFGWERVAHEVLEAWKPRYQNTDIEDVEMKRPDEVKKLWLKDKDLEKKSAKKSAKENKLVEKIAEKSAEKDKLVKKSAKTIEAGSAVVKCTPDMFVPKKANNNSINVTGSSVVKVTRDMICY